jgi:hypothetical protein
MLDEILFLLEGELIGCADLFFWVCNLLEYFVFDILEVLSDRLYKHSSMILHTYLLKTC